MSRPNRYVGDQKEAQGILTHIQALLGKSAGSELSPEDAKLLYTAMLEAQLEGDSGAVAVLAQLAGEPDKLHELFEQADAKQTGAKMLFGHRRFLAPPRLKILPYQTKGAGTCKQGERSDLTGCTPATHDPAQPKPPGSQNEAPKPSGAPKQNAPKKNLRRYQIGRKLAENCQGCTHVLGRLEHTQKHGRQAGKSVLLMEKWTPAMNDGWMDVIIEQKRPVEFAHPIKKTDFYTKIQNPATGEESEELAILHHEVGRLIDAGYKPVRNEEGHLVSMAPPGQEGNRP